LTTRLQSTSANFLENRELPTVAEVLRVVPYQTLSENGGILHQQDTNPQRDQSLSSVGLGFILYFVLFTSQLGQRYLTS